MKPCGVITKVLSILLQEVLGKRLCAKKPWISQATLIIEQRRQAIQRGDVEEYRRLAGPRRRSLLAPDSFATGMDWLLDRTVESCSIGVVFG